MKCVVEKPIYLFSDWKKIEKLFRNRFIYLLLDYDGTLTPIADTPRKAIMPARAKTLLHRLSGLSRCKVAIVSGRRLSDVKKRVGLKNIIYVGNHGFEIKGPGVKFENPLPKHYKASLDEIKSKLKRRLSGIKGVIVEDKGFSLGVHYRLVSNKNIPEVKNIFYDITSAYETKNIITVKTGKMALEIRPPMAWDKGKVVLWLLARLSASIRNKNIKTLPVYIGDDTTDEDAFESLGNKGITVFVGNPKNTKARFYLKEPDEVARFLETILNMQRQVTYAGK
ncbi:MAG: trehalose-phosphatase [Candidatus Omnitrophota bacterium]